MDQDAQRSHPIAQIQSWPPAAVPLVVEHTEAVAGKVGMIFRRAFDKRRWQAIKAPNRDSSSSCGVQRHFAGSGASAEPCGIWRGIILSGASTGGCSPNAPSIGPTMPKIGERSLCV